ncbi:hypothetical protein JZ751_008156 [Albula glossodonta]|uniref:Uncharacterized protein n=1 Tax=Albula glossodonta TaxID=121402 RepID=A0A8T2N3C5_9TELE|nr:hypothetical protein JZ751_008156 [Albula glossodonta]
MVLSMTGAPRPVFPSAAQKKGGGSIAKRITPLTRKGISLASSQNHLPHNGHPSDALPQKQTHLIPANLHSSADSRCCGLHIINISYAARVLSGLDPQHS